MPQNNKFIKLVTNLSIRKDYGSLFRILEKHDSIGQFRDEGGNNILHIAASSGNEPLLRKLCDKYKFEINDVNTQGNSPLNCSVIKNSLSCAKLLLENGADVNLQNKKGIAPVHHASAMGNANLLKEIIIHQGDVEKKSTFGIKPIEYSLAFKNFLPFSLFLAVGADSNIAKKFHPLPDKFSYVLSLAKGADVVLDSGDLSSSVEFAVKSFKENPVPSSRVLINLIKKTSSVDEFNLLKDGIFRIIDDTVKQDILMSSVSFDIKKLLLNRCIEKILEDEAINLIGQLENDLF